jgi:Trypsin-co-occurring domain 2
MARSLRTLAILVYGLAVGLPVAHAQQPATNNADFASGRQIDQVLTQVQAALVKVQTEAASASLPALASVSLELKTEFGYSAKGELNLYVVTAGGAVENENAQRVLLTLTPPKPYTEQPIAASDITESLSTAILAAARGIANAQKRKPPLSLSKLEAEIRFVVKASGEGGLKFEILPITASLKGDVKTSAIQTATVVFQAPGK